MAENAIPQFQIDEIFRFVPRSDNCINVLEEYVKRMIHW